MSRPSQPESAPQTGQASPGNDVLLYRRATGLSVDALNLSTTPLRGRQANHRVLDDFILPILYEHQIERARGSSKLKSPPTSEEVAKELGALPVKSMHRVVEADVVDVVSAHGDTLVQVDYDEFTDEQTDMARAAREIMGLPEGYNFRLGSAEAGVIIATAELSDEKMLAVRGAMAATLSFSPVRHDFPE